jgi:hypothetical protein
MGIERLALNTDQILWRIERMKGTIEVARFGM